MLKRMFCKAAAVIENQILKKMRNIHWGEWLSLRLLFIVISICLCHWRYVSMQEMPLFRKHIGLPVTSGCARHVELALGCV